MNRFAVLLTTLLLLAPASGSAFASPDEDREAASREADALDFAKRHHPELAQLLKRLKATNPNAYEKAVRDVAQAHDRLTRLHDNDPERHEFALRIWTLDSQIRLLAARSTMSDDPAIDEQLRMLLRERRDVRLAMLRHDRTRLQSRLERLNGQIDQLEHRTDESIEADLVRLKRAVKGSADRGRRDSEDRRIPSRRDGPKRSA